MVFNVMTTKVALGAVVMRVPSVTDLDQDPLEVIEDRRLGAGGRRQRDRRGREAGRRVSGGDDQRWYEIEKTRGDWFTDGDAADERPERKAPDTTVREEARDVPVHEETDVLVVGGGPAGCAAAVTAARASAPRSRSSSATATSAASPPAASSSGSTG